MMQIAGADVVGAGLYTFDFYSKSVGVSARFVFKGVGAGLGGDASGFVVPHDFGDISSSWSTLECDQPFSVWDLNGAWGRLTDLGGGIGIQYSLLFITAAPPWSWSRSYFHSQSAGGYGGGGAGGGGFVLVGNWRFKQVVNTTPASMGLERDAYA
jgi:hypothetical protein